jgi:predicted negative regulator of RcsB-dependent stress response
MIKKLVILIILGGLGYVGYLVWSNLSAEEKAVVSKKVGEVASDAKELAHKAADSLTDNAKDAIKKIDDKDKGTADGGAPAPAPEKSPDPPRTP